MRDNVGICLNSNRYSGRCLTIQDVLHEPLSGLSLTLPLCLSLLPLPGCLFPEESLGFSNLSQSAFHNPDHTNPI